MGTGRGQPARAAAFECRPAKGADPAGRERKAKASNGAAPEGTRPLRNLQKPVCLSPRTSAARAAKSRKTTSRPAPTGAKVAKDPGAGSPPDCRAGKIEARLRTARVLETKGRRFGSSPRHSAVHPTQSATKGTPAKGRASCSGSRVRVAASDRKSVV